MKNLPHQFNDPLKFREALRLTGVLNASGRDTSDDDELGYELVRAAVVNLQNVAGDLEARIAQERTKPRSKQGPLTAARETRRTLRLLGWLDETGSVTAEGQALLATEPASAEEKAVWRHALWHLELSTDEGTSHPAHVLVRLADLAPFPSRVGMELAFEAHDDSQAELARVSNLRKLPETALQETLTISKVTIDNARKILPRLADYAELLVLDDTGGFSPSEQARELAVLPPPHKPQKPPPGRRRRAGSSSEKKSAAEIGAPKNFDEATWSGLTEEEQLDAIRLRSERTTEHQECVRAVAALMEPLGELYEQTTAYDLVVVLSADRVLLIEVKTIRGDAPDQVRRAVGQLAYYTHFFVRPEWPHETIVRAVVVDAPIADDLALFLNTLDIALFQCEAGALAPLNDAAIGLANELGLNG